MPDAHAGQRRYLRTLAVLFAIWWIALSIAPWYRKDWALENALVVAFVAFGALTYRRLVLSRLSYTLVFAFLCLHEVGAHYTYAEVPYDAWFEALTGVTFNSLVGWQRDNYDRVVHFLWGLLIAYPIREIFLRAGGLRGFLGYFVPLTFMMASSALFELFEWLAAEVFGGDLGQAYLGTQGDVWDAHKDMALASFGALLALFATWARERARQRGGGVGGACAGAGEERMSAPAVAQTPGSMVR